MFHIKPASGTPLSIAHGPIAFTRTLGVNFHSPSSPVVILDNNQGAALVAGRSILNLFTQEDILTSSELIFPLGTGGAVTTKHPRDLTKYSSEVDIHRIAFSDPKKTLVPSQSPSFHTLATVPSIYPPFSLGC